MYSWRSAISISSNDCLVNELLDWSVSSCLYYITLYYGSTDYLVLEYYQILVEIAFELRTFHFFFNL